MEIFKKCEHFSGGGRGVGGGDAPNQLTFLSLVDAPVDSSKPIILYNNIIIHTNTECSGFFPDYLGG